MKKFSQILFVTLLSFYSVNLLAVESNSKPHSNISTNTSSLSVNEKELKQKITQQLQQQWQQAQLKRQEQRTLFLNLESLLKTAVSSGKISANSLKLAQGLVESLQDYPLQKDAKALLIESQYKVIDWQDTEMLDQLDKQIVAFVVENPNTTQAQQLAQYRFKLLGEQQKFSQLSAFANKVTAKSLENQAYLLKLDFQQLSQKLYPNSKEKHSLEKWANTNIMQRLEKLWLANASLPDDLQPVLKEWISLGGRTHSLIEQKMLHLFERNNSNALLALQTEIGNSALKTEISWLHKLSTSAASLPQLANQPDYGKDKQGKINPILQTAVYQSFFRFVKTLPEEMAKPDFNLYQQWAKNWQLTPSQQREWKIAFLTRLFDNQDSQFQQWRDQQLLKLKLDNLTERRLRMAIRQKMPFADWLALLSPQAKQKQEWRYWQGSVEPQKTLQIDTALSKERGFYPMLAAFRSQLSYKINIPSEIKGQLDMKFNAPLAEIAELRQLGRLNLAKTRWRSLFEKQNSANQLKLSQYALNQNWWDLAVDGTITAKAWDYLRLRMPAAYSQYFAINLKNSPISQSFAMAITRQESAYNPEVKSKANARGLMQLLPSTAKTTAKNNQLVYSGENDLFKPFNNIMLGTAHLAELNEKYPNNRILIAAAYNAGAKNVDNWLARAGGKLALDEFIASIPYYETRGYVQNVIAYDYYYQLLQARDKKPQIFSQTEYDRLY